MECIDFCLFGVYGVDTVETIVVEQPDNCRKGCPACSRVCPQNAIIFPQHKTPAIAGAPVDTGGLKIDLSKLFGAPDEGEDAAVVAARERDEQLILAGRQAVGMSQGISDRLAKQSDSSKKHDELDDLIDQLDSLDL
jgi:MinD superfamily P-loop ATPase